MSNDACRELLGYGGSWAVSAEESELGEDTWLLWDGFG